MWHLEPQQRNEKDFFFFYFFSNADANKSKLKKLMGLIFKKCFNRVTISDIYAMIDEYWTVRMKFHNLKQIFRVETLLEKRLDDLHS